MKNFTPDSFLSTRDHLTRDEIKSYLTDSMAEDEILHLENHLIDCAMCRNSVEYIQANGFEVLDKVGANVEERVKAKLAEKEKKKNRVESPNPPTMRTPQPPARPERPNTGATLPHPGYRRFAAVAMVVLLAAVGYFWLSRATYNLNDFRSEYANAGLIELEENTAGPISEFSRALEAYNGGQFDEAKQLFDAVPTSDSVHFQMIGAYLADIHRQKGEYDEAIAGFENFRAAHKGADYDRVVRWQLVAAYAQRADAEKGDFKQLKALLNEMIADPKQSNQEKAQNALSDLEKITPKSKD